MIRQILIFIKILSIPGFWSLICLSLLPNIIQLRWLYFLIACVLCNLVDIVYVYPLSRSFDTIFDIKHNKQSKIKMSIFELKKNSNVVVVCQRTLPLCFCDVMMKWCFVGVSYKKWYTRRREKSVRLWNFKKYVILFLYRIYFTKLFS